MSLTAYPTLRLRLTPEPALKLRFLPAIGRDGAPGPEGPVGPPGPAGGAPVDAQYLVAASHLSLTSERVVTDTATVTWDFTTAGQAKANAIGASGTETQRHVKQFGAVGNGVADDTAAIQAAINATPAGGRLRIPEGQYVVTSTLNRTTPIQLWGDGPQGATIVVGAAFSSASDVFHFAPTTATAGWAVSGFQIQGAGGTPRGRHAIHIDTVSGGQAYNFSIHNMIIQPTAAGNSIRVTNADASGGVHNSQFFDNNVESIYLLNVGDTFALRNNVITNSNSSSTNAGIYACQVSGAGNLQIIGNNIATLAGHIIFDGGVQPIICNNELETPHLITNLRGFMIELLGTLDLVRGGVLSDNQIQVLPSTGNPIPIKIANAANVRYSGGRNSVQSGPHVQITSAATDTVLDGGLQYVTLNVIGPPVISDAGTRTVWQLRSKGAPTVGQITRWASASELEGVNSSSFAREVLTANRNYFLSSTGNDANSGTSSGSPLRTLREVTNRIVKLDTAGFAVDVAFADGTYNYTSSENALFDKWWVGGGSVTFHGNSTTPANVTISVTGADVFTIRDAGAGILKIFDMKMQTVTSGDVLFVAANAAIWYGNVEFGAAAAHVRILAGGARIVPVQSYKINGNAAAHWIVNYGVIEAGTPGMVCSTSGTLTFSAAFVLLDLGAKVVSTGLTFTVASGSVSGVRHNLQLISAVQTGGASPLTYFPGNAAGIVQPSSVFA